MISKPPVFMVATTKQWALCVPRGCRPPPAAAPRPHVTPPTSTAPHLPHLLSLLLQHHTDRIRIPSETQPPNSFTKRSLSRPYLLCRRAPWCIPESQRRERKPRSSATNHAAMTSWYSNILTKTSSQISSLRSTLLSSEADGDSEDDTHVCRVLRNYYTDKARPLPSWLPPDPKAPPPAPLYAQAGLPAGGGPLRGYGGGGGGGGGGAAPAQQGGQQAGGLSSLWDSAPSGGGGQQVPSSLRAGRMAGGGRGGAADGLMRPPQLGQRMGSYQSSSGALPTPPSTTGAAGGGGVGGTSSAQDRLKQRLWGGAGGPRTGSPQGAGGQGPYQPPGGHSSSSLGGGGGGGGGGPSYEDRFAPGGTYDAGRGPDQPGGGQRRDDYGGGRPGAPPGGPRRQGMLGNQRGYR